MPDLVQVDLFGAGAIVAKGLRRESAPPPRARKKRMAETTHAAGLARPESRKRVDERAILEALVAAGGMGLTRQELANGLGIAIQTVCWAVDALLKRNDAFEPVIDYVNGKPVHLSRERRKVLVARIHERAGEAQRSA